MKRNNTPLKIAFIGSGAIVEGVHFSAVEKHSELFNVIGISDINIESAKRLAEKFGSGTRAFDSMETLYNEIGQQIDAVVIATPHFLHEPGGRFFLERGIPALIEKPAACNLKEVDSLLSHEREGAFIQVAQQQRFGREAIWLRDYIQDKEKFGKPLSFDLNIWQNIEGYIAGNYTHWILDGKKAGGGICISVACHPLDLLRFITGQDFTEVTAIGRFDPPFHNGAESSCSALFKMSGGLSGTLHASYKPTRVPYSQRLVLFGERGSLYQDTKMGDYSGPFLTASEDPKISQFQDMYGEFHAIQEHVDASFHDMEENPYAAQLLHFREAVIQGEKPTQNSLEINYNTMATLDAISTSISSGRTETVQQLSHHQ